jgi:hypothetical protein
VRKVVIIPLVYFNASLRKDWPSHKSQERILSDMAPSSKDINLYPVTIAGPGYKCDKTVLDSNTSNY